MSDSHNELFDRLRQELALFDPVAFAEQYLTIDGKPFNMSGAGWRYLAEVYRSVAAQATNKQSKPTVILKGRQVGATVMAAVLSLYFTASGLYGTGENSPPIRVLHLFPTIPIMHKYVKDKLEPMMRQSQGNYIELKGLSKDDVHHAVGQDDTLTVKTFKGFNKLRTDAIGKDADRIRGLTQDCIMFDECFPYDQCVETEDGKEKIGVIFDRMQAGKKVPMVKTYNESMDKFEYKSVLNAWKRGEKPLIEISCGKRRIRCTDNHRFLTMNGWKQAGELEVGDLIKTAIDGQIYVRALNDDQHQIVLGSFLGDGHLSQYKNARYRLKVTHGISQSDYCMWKASMFGTDVSFVEKNGYSQKPAIKFGTKMFGMKNLPKTKTECPQWVLDELDHRGLAVWFMDDGSIQSYDKQGARISTCSFDEESQKRIVEKLQSFGIKSRYEKYCGYYYILLSKEGHKKLSNLISPYVHDSMLYKLDIDRAPLKYQWDSNFREHGYECVDSVKETSKVEEVYDIEVADNHNFIVTPKKNSKNLGGLIAHNCQDMNSGAIENALRILTAAQYGKPTQGIQMYFGTPKESGSKFWQLWQDSDQRFYQLRCVSPSCKDYFFLYEYGSDSWKETWVEGHTVKCPHCKTLQDKRIAVDGGRWIATRDEATSRYVGYHINLMLSPIFTKEMVMDYDPEVNPNRSERAWKNETIGEFYSSGGLPLTMEDIVTNALDETRGISKGVKEKTDKVYVLGVDWGDKSLSTEDDMQRGQSYTAMVVMSVNHAGVFTIENAFRLRKNGFTHRVRAVEELFEKYQIRNAAADLGFGNDVVDYLQVDKGYKSRMLGCINSGTLAKTISFDPKNTRVILNKDRMIDEIFSMIRRGKIKFPVQGGSWDSLLWLMQHCASMEVKTVMKSDNYSKRYIKGSIPNDGLMALMYALVAYKFIATGGFAVRKQSHESSVFPQPLLAFAPQIKG